jgi:hypothetical protein
MPIRAKCGGKDRNLKQCRTSSIENSKFCKLHQYMNEYTEDMLNNKLTLGC